jgi:hypothetical protein
MKTASLVLLVVGILVFLAGVVFALQGDDIIKGSGMTGNPFWISAGTGVAIVGLLITIGGVWMGSRRKVATAQTS